MEILDVVRECEVHGLAHITGSGVMKLKRLKNMKYVIDKPLKPQEIFRFIQKLGDVDEAEMYRTFNMGMGFMVILPESEVEKLEKLCEGRVVGHVEDGEGVYVKDLRIDA